MKNYLSAFFPLAFIAILVFSSCASQLPQIDREISDDCLVIIPTTISNKSGDPVARDYYLDFSNGVKKRKISDKSNHYIVIRIRESGVKIIGLSTSVNRSDYTGASYQYDINISLPYKKGEVLVSDYTFEQYLQRINETTFQSSWDFIETKDADYEKYLDKFMATDVSKSWVK